MSMSRLTALLIVVGWICAWLVGDELRQHSQQSQIQTQRLTLEQKKLEKLVRDPLLFERAATARQSSERLLGAAYQGETLTGARAKLASDLQQLFAKRNAAGAQFRLVRSSASGAQDSFAQPSQSVDRPGANARSLPDDHYPEPFSVSGTFTPEVLGQVLLDFSTHPRLLRLDGLSVKGSRFELFGTAVVSVQGALEGGRQR